MAKVKLNQIFTALTGKLCGEENQYFGTYKQNGMVYTASLCHPYKGPRTQAQIAVMEAFTAKSRLVAQWFAQNKPSEQQPKGTELYQAVKSAFKSQHVFGNIRAFVSKKMDAQGNLSITVTDFEGGGGTSGDGNSGGGNNQGGGGDEFEGGGM